ncbi:hypothetical protein WN943_000722 [Citrus x changshan-huyou]
MGLRTWYASYLKSGTLQHSSRGMPIAKGIEQDSVHKHAYSHTCLIGLNQFFLHHALLVDSGLIGHHF